MEFRRIVLLLILLSQDSSRGAPGDELWDDRFDTLGIEGEVRAIVAMGNDVYLGGQFTKAGGVEASNIARWNGFVWEGLGGGLSSGGDVNQEAAVQPRMNTDEHGSERLTKVGRFTHQVNAIFSPNPC